MKSEAVGVALLVVLIIWLNSRQEYVQSNFVPVQPIVIDWWDYWYATGGA